MSADPINLRRHVNAVVIKAMKDAHVSRAELARKLKCSRVTVTQMLRVPRNMKLDTLENVGRALGCSVNISLLVNKGRRK